ncbi:diguanylate cyclase [Marinospirillum sp. MEB164]|uniref:Diguanylate cyclase n=1 Tax=Marinospirillum alkalitolerans TaxID=3123374 RepID=A0ABW8PYQ2_9GAMM
MHKTYLSALFFFVISSCVAFQVAAQPMRLCIDPDWEPFERLSPTGEFTGVGADLLALIFERAQIEYVIHPTATWEESLAAARRGECDGLGLLNQTPERSQWLIFTEPYLRDPNVIITRRDHPSVAGFAALGSARGVLPIGTAMLEHLDRDYPELFLFPVETEREAFEWVDQGRAEFTLRSLLVAAYTIRNEGWFNLKIAGYAPEYTNHFRIGLLPEHTIWRDQLNQAIATLTPGEIDHIINRYVRIEVEQKHDWLYLTQVVLGLGLVITLLSLLAVFQYRSRRFLVQLKRRLEATLQQKEEIAARLRESEHFYRSLIETAHEGIAVVQQGRLVYVNPRLAELCGYTAAELYTLPSFLVLVHEEDRALIAEHYQQRLQGGRAPQRYEIRVLPRDQEPLVVEISGVRVDWFGQPATLNFVTDITERRASEEQIRYLAHYDQLTGLANRHLLMERLHLLLAQARVAQQRLGLIFLDLNGFKPVNDTYGHEVGDQLLQAVAQRLQQELQQSLPLDFTLARFGGDEFVLLLPDWATLEVEGVLAAIRSCFTQAFDLQGQKFNIQTSIGYALYPDHGQDAEALLRYADQQMYAHKSRQKAASVQTQQLTASQQQSSNC